MAAFANEFSWSFTRDRLYRRCPRAYYYQYYGYWTGWRESAPEPVRKLYFLRGLTGIHAWKGKVVEWVIQHHLDRLRARRGIRLASVDELHKQAAERLRAQWRESFGNLGHRQPKQFRLAEHYYHFVHGEAAPDRLATRIQEEIRVCLRHFFESGLFDEFRRLRRDDWLYLQPNTDDDVRPPDFTVDDVRIWAALDLAVRDGTGATIYDWKAGRHLSREEPLQLACYALYVQQEYEVLATAIRTMVVALQNPPPWSADEVTQERIDETREHIRESVRRLRSALADPETNTAREEDFPLNATPQTCPTCNFREVCPGWAEIRAGALSRGEGEDEGWTAEA